MSTIHLSLLGSFEISPVDGNALRRKERALLAYLAVQARPFPRQALLPLFYARAEDPAAALRLSLSRLRRALGPDCLLTEGRTVQWSLRTKVDYAAFVPVVSNYTAHSADALAAALALYRGEFLAGLTLEDAPEADLWLMQERAHLQTLYERGALELIRRQRLAGQWDTAIRQTRILLNHNPSLEPAHANLLWLYHQTGQTDTAQAHYETYRELAQEMGLPLSPELQQLAAGEHRASSFPPAKKQFPFAGREAELRTLHANWQDAQKGQGRFILLEGEAGVGKSTLVAHFTQQYAHPLLTGNSYETAQHLPYTPWIELLESALNTTPKQLMALPAYSRETFARFLPGFGERLGIRPGRGALLVTVGQEATHLFQAFTDGLFALFEGAKPMLFLDNLQWADEASLMLLHFAARRAFRQGWMIVGARRTGGEAETPALGKMLEGLHPRLARLALSGLSSPEIAILTASYWPQLPPISREIWASRLTQATGGNPFFVCELLRELAGQEPGTAHLPIPASVRDLVEQRMQFLPSGGQGVLGALAVLDGPATPAHLQSMSERPMGETLDVLDEGQRRGLLCVDGEQYAFAHDLVREVVLAGLSPARRRWLHGQAAEQYEAEAEQVTHSERGELAGRILHHARAGDDPARVFTWGREVADYALRLNAIGEAYQAIEAVLTAFPRLPQTQANERQFLRVLLDSVWLIDQMGRPVMEARTRLEQAHEILARTPDQDLQALYHLREALVLSGEGQYRAAIPAALIAYEFFMDLGDTRGAAWSLHSAGRYEMTLSHNHAGRQLFTQALELYQTSGDAREEASVLSNLAWVDLNLGQPGKAIAGLARVLALAQEAGDVLAQAEVCNTLAAAWNFFYRGDRVRAYAQEAFDLYGRLRLPNSRARVYLGTAAWVLEGVDAARKEFLLTYEDAVAQNDFWLRGWAAQLLGRAAFYKGDLDAAEKWLAEAAALRKEAGERANQVSDLAWLGCLRLARGDVYSAFSLTRRAIEGLDALKEEAWVFETWDVYQAHADVLATQGKRNEAVNFVQRAQENRMWMAAQAPDETTREGFLRWSQRF